MSRINEIDVFLRKLSHLAKTNNTTITPNLVYSQLIRYDLTPEELKNSSNISKYFDYWTQYFKNQKNINVFNHPSQKSFLQFWNNRDYDSEFIKLYVSVNSNSMLKSVNEIFSHLESRNVTQCSKVSNQLRSDSIVLRIKNDEDAKEIIDFINKNKFIKNGAKKTNPFVLRNGIVGMAYDDNLSYNTAVSFLVSEYINSKNENQDLSNANCIDFSNYVSNYSRQLITNKDFLNKFMETDYFKDNNYRLEDCDKAEVLSNMKRVFDLINFSLKENRTYEEFISMYKDSIKNKKDMCNDFKELIDGKENAQQQDQLKEVRPTNLLNEYLDVAFLKYQTKSNVLAYLKSYENGNVNAITRDKNLRMKFLKDLSPQKLQSLTNGNLEEYIEKYLEFKDKNSLFINSCIATYEKYGLSHLGYAINKAMKGDYSSFTRDNGLRSMMKDMLNEKDIQNIIMQASESADIDFNDNYALSYAYMIEDMLNERNTKSK